MFTISKTFSFSASHILDPKVLPMGHPCARLHGHNYEISVELRGERSKAGFIRDYRELDVIKGFIDSHLDHQHLNERVPDTTAEGLAEYLFGKFKALVPEVSAVRVSETPKTWAEFRGDK